MQLGGSGHHVRLRTVEFIDAFAKRGLLSDSDIAKVLGVSPSTIWRLRLGATSPSADLIACILKEVSDLRFEDLFEIAQLEHAGS